MIGSKRQHRIGQVLGGAPDARTFDPRPPSNIGATWWKKGSRFHISTITTAPLTTFPSGVIAEAALHFGRFDVTRERGSGTMKIIERLLLSNVATCKQFMIVTGNMVWDVEKCGVLSRWAPRDILEINASQIRTFLLKSFVVIDFPITNRARCIIEYSKSLRRMWCSGGNHPFQLRQKCMPSHQHCRWIDRCAERDYSETDQHNLTQQRAQFHRELSMIFLNRTATFATHHKRRVWRKA